MSATTREPTTPLVEVIRMLSVLVWVSGATAVTLGVLGRVPTWLAGEERHVRAVPTVDDAARWTGARLFLPAYFPRRFAWPPERVRIAGGHGGSVAVTFASAEDGRPALELLQATVPGEAVSPHLTGRPSRLHESRTTVGNRPATIANVLLDGENWQEISWQEGGIALVLRARAGEPELHRLAHALRREGSGP